MTQPSHSDHDAHSHHHAAEPTNGAGLVACPVMPNNLVNIQRAEEKGLYRDHKGRRYWFCCSACGPLWDDDPEKYAAAS